MRSLPKSSRLATHFKGVTLFLLLSAATASSVSAQNDSIRIRRIWKGDIGNICCHVFPKPSADGRYIPGVDWITGNLAYLDLREDRWIRATDKGNWTESQEFSMNAIFSPDGTKLAHTWFSLEGGEGSFDLRVQDLDGQNVRVLVSSEVSEYSWPLDWSPDGESILAVLTRIPEAAQPGAGDAPGMSRVVRIPVDGSGVEALKDLDPNVNPGNPTARFSPDGQWIAYEEVTSDPPVYDIHLLSVDGAVDRPLVTGNGDDRLLDWLPDGSGILFHSERNLTQGIWELSIRDGFPSGTPKLIKGDVWGIFGMGFGPEGLYYMVPIEAPQVYTAMIDLERGELTSPPNPVREITAGAGLYPAWSPDGRQLAFVDRGPPGAARSRLVIQSLETGESQTISVPLQGLQRLQWDPEGRSVTGIASYRGVTGFHRLDLRTGEVNTLVDTDALGALTFRLSRDGRTLLYVPRATDRRVKLRARDLETGNEREIITLDGESGKLADFPGGRRYAVWTNYISSTASSRLVTVNSDGSGTRILWEGPREFVGPPQVEVTQDGRHILVGGARFVGEGFALLSFDAETGERRVIDPNTPGTPGEVMGQFTPHPDGSRIAFWRGVARGEIWVLEYGVR